MEGRRERQKDQNKRRTGVFNSSLERHTEQETDSLLENSTRLSTESDPSASYETTHGETVPPWVLWVYSPRTKKSMRGSVRVTTTLFPC